MANQFITDAIGVTQEEKKEDVVTDPTKVEPVEGGEDVTKVIPESGVDVVKTPEEVKESPVAEKVEEKPVETVPSKVKIDYQPWLTDNEEVIADYFRNKDKDFNSMSDQEAVRTQLKRDNPGWDNGDIDAELADKYGIGIEHIDIDEDDMDADEIREAKKHNASIEKGLRLLKTEGKKAKDSLTKYKESLTLPEFEYEMEAQGGQPQEGYYTPEVFAQKQANDVQEYKEKTWIPQLTEAVSSVESVTHNVEIEEEGGKVALNISYSLSDAEKQELVDYLADYSGHPSDEKYIKDGAVDLQSFLQDKATEKFYKKIIQVGIQEALTKGRKEVIKNELLNFDGGGSNRKTPSDVTKTPEESLQDMVWGRNHR